MKVTFSDPLERAYERMKVVLFQPFDPGKWLVVGFGCWLANLTESFGGGIPSWSVDLFDDSEADPVASWEWPSFFGEEPWVLGCGTLVLLMLLGILLLVLLLVWLNSRGQFVFLDNVAHNRAEIREPWNRYAALGDSLFFWRLGFLILALVLVLAAAVPLFTVLLSLENEVTYAVGEFAAVALSVLPLATVTVGVLYTRLFLLHFVVPIMRQEGLGTAAAWGRFLPALRQNLGAFLLYGLFVLALRIGVTIALLFAIVLTCCIAAIPLIIPYIGTVLLLPVHVVFRAFGVEFLAQLMPALALPPLALPGKANPETVHAG